MSQSNVAGTARPGAAAGPKVELGEGMTKGLDRMSSTVKYLLIFGLLAIAGVGAWYFLRTPGLPPGFAGGNGRLEANQIYVATKYPGRIAQVNFDEGDMVDAGQVVARMDTSALEAQLREAQAQVLAARDARNAARAQVDVRQANYDY